MTKHKLSNYHLGELPDKRTISVCQKILGKDCPPILHHARQLKKSDFEEFDFILYMDESNGIDIKKIAPKQPYHSQIFPLGSFDPKKELNDTEIEDPYYDSSLQRFEKNFELINSSLENFLNSILEK